MPTLPDVGEVRALDDWLRLTTPEAQTLKLYKTAVTPAEGDTAASYTEYTGAGYAAKALTRATWNAASTAAGVTTITYPAQTFNFTGAGTLYGYFVVGTTSATLYFSELMFASGQVFANGDSYVLTLSVAMD